MDGSIAFARLRLQSAPYLTYASLGLPYSPYPKRHLDWFSRFCTSRQRVSILYNGPPFSLKIALSHRGSGPHLINVVPWTHPSTQPKPHLDWFSRFCRAHDRDRQTDRQTDRTDRACMVYSVCKNRPHLRCGIVTSSIEMDIIG